MLAAVVGAEVMWKSVVSISKVCGTHTVISSALFFARAAFSCDEAQPIEELCLGLLHATCGLGVADCRCDPFQGIGGQPWT